MSGSGTSGRDDARAAIFSSIRSSLGVSSSDEDRQKSVAAKLSAHKPNLIPARARGSRQELVERFRTMMEGQDGEVHFLEKADEIPARISDLLREKNLPAALRMGSDARLTGLAWEKVPQLERLSGPTSGDDKVTLSFGFGAAAETGTLFLLSGAENPTTLNFLADTHIVVIEENSIAGSYEEVWAKVRDVYGSGTMPRVVNLIGGPSRTADIEQTIIKGAHGPRQLVVIVVNSTS